MIYDAPSLPSPLHLKADLCVVGSGAGGATVARVAAEAGLKVVLLEAGEMLTPADMSQREEEMFSRLYWESGGRASSDRRVRIHQGRGVGGSTLHNLNLCKRIPDALLTGWGAGEALGSLSLTDWHRLYDEIEAWIGVSTVKPDQINRHNRILETGCRELGWRGGPLRHNREGCIGSGFCELGCAYDGKNHVLKTMIPPAVRGGAEVLALCQAVRLRHDGRRVRGVEAVALDPRTRRAVGEVMVDAPQTCLSASATGTAALLLRSHVPDRSRTQGRGLRVHPAVVVAAEFDEPVRAHEGIPQSYECTEWLELDRDDGPHVWIVPAFAHPVGTATMMPGYGDPHRRTMERYPNLAVLTAMIHDQTAGRVEPRGALGLLIHYEPNQRDRSQLSRGLWACARLLQAGGARRIHVPARRTRSFGPAEEVDGLRDVDVMAEGHPLTAVHPMASVPMNDDPTRGAVSSEGRHHGLDGLWIADGSLFPSSIGVPPQLSIHALGLHVGRRLVAHS